MGYHLTCGRVSRQSQRVMGVDATREYQKSLFKKENLLSMMLILQYILETSVPSFISKKPDEISIISIFAYISLKIGNLGEISIMTSLWLKHEMFVLFFMYGKRRHIAIPWYGLTGGNWQKLKRVFLTCPCHEIYRDEAFGLKSCKNTWKITIFVKMWNLGQYRENLIFCQ